MARWLWESGFTAVAGDAPGFERIPLELGEEKGLEGFCLHEVLLAGWWMPVGEYNDGYGSGGCWMGGKSWSR